MLWLLKRWYFWLGLVLLLTASARLIYSSQHRLTQENFDRIRKGMPKDEVVDILGLDYEYRKYGNLELCSWLDGPDCIHLRFIDGKVVFDEGMYCATPSEALKWYLRRGLEKVGICWDDPPIPAPDPRPE